VLVSRADDGATRLVLFDEQGLAVREEGTVRPLADALRDLMWVPEDEARRLEDAVAPEWPDVRGSSRGGGGLLNQAAPWATLLAWAAVGAVVALAARGATAGCSSSMCGRRSGQRILALAIVLLLPGCGASGGRPKATPADARATAVAFMVAMVEERDVNRASRLADPGERSSLSKLRDAFAYFGARRFEHVSPFNCSTTDPATRCFEAVVTGSRRGARTAVSGHGELQVVVLRDYGRSVVTQHVWQARVSLAKP
jgi:hypothetical protein